MLPKYILLFSQVGFCFTQLVSVELYIGTKKHLNPFSGMLSILKLLYVRDWRGLNFGICDRRREFCERGAYFSVA
ncbi:hypothetical protein V1525DRAFT_34893 [Lipomyces kononenkoae]|uniref:Uncharacterized protein n=1 Tax=Lipomyces kononenkoae TaxID=34357 RepID=A0ACC3ST26_LIPKO